MLNLAGGNGRTAAKQPQQRAPSFERKTDPRRQPVVTGQSMNLSATFTQALPKVGYLAGIYIRAYPFVNFANQAGASLATWGPWDLFTRIQLKTNLGSQYPWDASGYMTYVRSFQIEQAYDETQSPNYASGIGNTDNAWQLEYYQPIALNLGLDRRWGLINLQAEETQVYLTLQSGAVSNIVSGGTTAQVYTAAAKGGTAGAFLFDVYYDYYSVPTPGSAQAPPRALHYYLEDYISVSATGDQFKRILPQGTLLRLNLAAMLNGTLADGLDHLEWRYNLSSKPQIISAQQNKRDFRMKFGGRPPVGVYSLDRWNVMLIPSTGPLWDAINTEAITTVEFNPNVKSTQAIATGDTIRYARELLQYLR
jgi:hypothetical protein